MIVDADVERFTQFYEAGGLKEAENLTKGKAIKTVATTTGSDYKATVIDEANYKSDGVQRLPAAILSLSTELSDAANTLSGWNSYITTASDPLDLVQVDQGADVYRKVKGESNDVAWPSILPITSKPELVALESAVNEVYAYVSETKTLMTEINASVWPDPIVTTPGGTPTRIPVALTPAQISKCLTLAGKLESEVGKVAAASKVIAGMVNAATTSRATALSYFGKAITFTVCANQVKSPSVSDATKEVFAYA